MEGAIGRGKFRETRRSGEITSGTTIASAGKLTPEQDDMFIRTGIDSSDILSLVTQHVMRSHQKYLESFSLATRLLRKPGEATAASNTGITPARRTLSVEEVVLTYTPTYDFFEDNIEREGGEQALADEFKIAFFNDLADLGVNGDGSTPGFLACNTGWLKLIKDASSTNKYDLTASILSAGDWEGVILPGMYAALPDKYKGSNTKPNFRFLMAVDDVETWVKQCRARGTSLGDSTLQSGKVPAWNGIEIVPITHMASGTALLVRPKNLAFGIRRGVTMEMQKQPKERIVETTLSARVDYEFAVEDEIVIGYDVTP